MPEDSDRQHAIPEPNIELRAFAQSLVNANLGEFGPIYVLALVRAMRRELRDYEREVAQAAIKSGATYTELGDALGMTRQGAQRRYAAGSERSERRRRSTQP